MAERRLGRTGLSVSEVGCGGFQFTGEFGVPKQEALAIIRAALDAGINYFDTAPMYGFGESEELLGRGLSGFDNHPVVVSGKVGWLDRTVVRAAGDNAYTDREAIMRVVEHSLWLLRRDRLDIVMIHEPEWPQWKIDVATGDSVVLSTLEDLKKAGLVGGIGIGGQDLAVNTALVETGRIDVVLTFMHYDLAVQDARDALLPAAARHDVGVILGGPYRQGALAAKATERIAEMRRTGVYPWGFDERVLRRLDAIYALSDRVGLSLPELGLRYLLSDPRVSSVIPGPRKVEELARNLAYAAKGPLEAELVAEIDRIGGT
jgi:aryl-alcohol dehydrogenase-like predicted oxidoreductase